MIAVVVMMMMMMMMMRAVAVDVVFTDDRSLAEVSSLPMILSW